MPRVLTKKKSSRGESYSCVRCDEPIKAGDEYYEWTFFRSTPRRQHKAHGYPRPSQLDNSKMSTVLASIEDAEDTIGKATTNSDISSALESVVESAREVASEYEEAMEAMGSAGESGTSAERKDALESFADDVESEANDIEQDEFDHDEDAEETESEQRDSWLEDLRQKAYDVLGNLSV